jgi:hypothetical protein
MSNVINMFAAKEENKKVVEKQTPEDLKKVIEANRANAERVRREREKANKNIVRGLRK